MSGNRTSVFSVEDPCFDTESHPHGDHAVADAVQAKPIFQQRQRRRARLLEDVSNARRRVLAVTCCGTLRLDAGADQIADLWAEHDT